MERVERPIPALITLALVIALAGCDTVPTGPQGLTPPQAAESPGPTGKAMVSGDAVVTGVLARPNESVTPGGTTRYRGTIFVVTLTGDVEGEFEYVQTSNWNKFGNGALTGKIDGEVTWDGRTGGISGSGAVNVSEFFLSGNFVVHGSGGLAKQKLRLNLEGPLGCTPSAPCSYNGFVQGPAAK